MTEFAGPRLGGMVPSLGVLASVDQNSLILPDGHPKPELRARLRRIPSARNALSIVGIYAQTIGIVALALAVHHPVTYAAAFLLMGRAHAQSLALMHESVHRLLFRNRRANDFAGRWLLGYPCFVNTDGYRHVHMAHHREEFGPNEPDIALYANYPVTRASFWRKMRRDATGRTGLRLLREQLSAMFAGPSPSRTSQMRIIGVQAVMLATISIVSHPLVYVVFWLLPYLTVWRVMNRLRSIAEHGGMRADDDRRMTTHSVRQHPLPSFFFVPFNLGWHIAHHADPGVPFRSLPAFHGELRRSGFVSDAWEYPNYRALWRALRAG
jgi:fatty acid desaturase